MEDLEKVIEEYNIGLRELSVAVRELREIQYETRDLMASLVNGGHIRTAVGLANQHAELKRTQEIINPERPLHVVEELRNTI